MVWLVAVLHLGIMSLALFHALLRKRDHRAALGWFWVIVAFPVGGPIAYFIFGINRVRTRARQVLGHHTPRLFFGEEPAREVLVNHSDPLGVETPEPRLAQIGGRVAGTPLHSGNVVEALFNGEQCFPRLIEAMDQAEQYILLSSYLFSATGVAAEVIAAATRAVQRGVRVRVLIDGIGVLYSRALAVRELRRGGVEVRLFLPPSFLPPAFVGINLRNHRKIAVVDGHRGFYGGINIDQRHMVADASTSRPTEDVHFLVTGCVVEDLQKVFQADWQMAGGAPLGESPVPCQRQGEVFCRVIPDGPDERLDQLSMTLIGLFTAARKEISIMVPYFLPPREMMVALQAAVLRGVKVRVILPERSNLRMVDWATRKMLWELLAWHVEIYYKSAPFAHSKLILVDDHYALGGSANLDARSLRLNFEVGVEMLGGEVNRVLRQHIVKVLSRCRRATLVELDQRSYLQKARDAFFWLFSSYL